MNKLEKTLKDHPEVNKFLSYASVAAAASAVTMVLARKQAVTWIGAGAHAALNMIHLKGLDAVNEMFSSLFDKT